MLRITTIITITLLTSACANASSGGKHFDSSNPVACLAIFGIAANGFQQAGDGAAAEKMLQKSMFLARQHGGAEWIQNVTPEARQLGASIEASKDGDASLRLLQECEANQNSNSGSHS